MREDWQQLIDQTVQDRTLRDAYVWQPFARGSSNSIFLGNAKPDASAAATASPLVETVVLRINAPAKDTPGVIRDREAAILNWLAPYPWAPQIIANKPDEGWCLMHHYAPLKVTAQNQGAKSLPHAHQQQLLNAINELQATPVSSNTSNDLTMDYLGLLDETYLPVAIQKNDVTVQTRIASVKNNLSGLPALSQCLVHHDIHSGNLVLSKPTSASSSKSNLIILDWEYAAIGNPWFDASCLSRYLSIPDQKIYELSLFKTLDEVAFESALKQANEMTEALQKLWYWLREQ